MPIIEARGLTKKFRQAVKEPGLVGSLKHFFNRKYKDKLAVDHIDFGVEAGESVAYLGPNGAGKSTTIKMLTGILVPTSGSLIVDGLVPHEKRQQNARNIGVVFGQRTQLWWDIPVVESFNLARDMYEIPVKRYRDNLAQFTEILGLSEFINLPAAKISLGQRMRADLCMALLHDPKILYLDEPTIGLDIAVKDSIRQFVRSRSSTTATWPPSRTTTPATGSFTSSWLDRLSRWRLSAPDCRPARRRPTACACRSGSIDSSSPPARSPQP